MADYDIDALLAELENVGCANNNPRIGTCSACDRQLRAAAALRAEHERAERAEAEAARLRAALHELREALSWEDAKIRLDYPDPLFAEQVRALGERVGYGVVMSEASRLWYEKAGGGAFAVAGCIVMVERADERARDALAQPQPEEAQ